MKKKSEKKKKPETLREKLIREASEKPIRRFYQFDVHRGEPGGGDSVMHYDDDGDCLTSGLTYEFNRSATLRILIPAGWGTRKDTIRCIEKIAKCLVDDPEVDFADGYAQGKDPWGNICVIEPECVTKDRITIETLFNNINSETLKVIEWYLHDKKQAIKKAHGDDDCIPF